MKDLLLSKPTNDPNSNIVFVRLQQPSEETQFMISYTKKEYKSEQHAKEESVLTPATAKAVLEDFKDL